MRSFGCTRSRCSFCWHRTIGSPTTVVGRTSRQLSGRCRLCGPEPERGWGGPGGRSSVWIAKSVAKPLLLRIRGSSDSTRSLESTSLGASIRPRGPDVGCRQGAGWQVTGRPAYQRNPRTRDTSRWLLEQPDCRCRLAARGWGAGGSERGPTARRRRDSLPTSMICCGERLGCRVGSRSERIRYRSPTPSTHGSADALRSADR